MRFSDDEQHIFGAALFNAAKTMGGGYADAYKHAKREVLKRRWYLLRTDDEDESRISTALTVYDHEDEQSYSFLSIETAIDECYWTFSTEEEAKCEKEDIDDATGHDFELEVIRGDALMDLMKIESL